MTFCGGSTEDGGFEMAGRGRGVDIGCERIESLLLLRDFRRDFIVRYRENAERYRSRRGTNLKAIDVSHVLLSARG
jgi:hypothetical protein